MSSGLTERQLLDLFDRTEAQPLIREAIRQTIHGGNPSPLALPDDRDSRTLTLDEAGVERLAAALTGLVGTDASADLGPEEGDVYIGSTEFARRLIEALRDG